MNYRHLHVYKDTNLTYEDVQQDGSGHYIKLHNITNTNYDTIYVYKNIWDNRPVVYNNFNVFMADNSWWLMGGNLPTGNDQQTFGESNETWAERILKDNRKSCECGTTITMRPDEDHWQFHSDWCPVYQKKLEVTVTKKDE